MKNLDREELKKSLRKEIASAIKNMKNPDAHITIRFTDDQEIIGIETIDIIMDSIYFKKVNLCSLTREDAINLIVENLYYSYFNYVNTKIKKGEPEIHGFNESWGRDKIVINYHRYKDE